MNFTVDSHDALDAERMQVTILFWTMLTVYLQALTTHMDSPMYREHYKLPIWLDYKGFSGFVQFYGASNVTRYVGLEGLGGVRNTVFDEGSYWSKEMLRRRSTSKMAGSG